MLHEYCCFYTIQSTFNSLFEIVNRRLTLLGVDSCMQLLLFINEIKLEYRKVCWSTILSTQYGRGTNPGRCSVQLLVIGVYPIATKVNLA